MIAVFEDLRFSWLKFEGRRNLAGKSVVRTTKVLRHVNLIGYQSLILFIEEYKGKPIKRFHITEVLCVASQNQTFFLAEMHFNGCNTSLNIFHLRMWIENHPYITWSCKWSLKVVRNKAWKFEFEIIENPNFRPIALFIGKACIYFQNHKDPYFHFGYTTKIQCHCLYQIKLYNARSEDNYEFSFF